MCSIDENGIEVNDEILFLLKFELNVVEIGVVNNSCLFDELFMFGGSLKFIGYDFSKYINGMDIFIWFFRVSFRGFFISLWLSIDEEDVGWLLGLEELCDE